MWLHADFDRSRAQWEAKLFEGLADGRAAYVLRLHHAMSDGLGIIQLLSRVFTLDDASLALRAAAGLRDDDRDAHSQRALLHRHQQRPRGGDRTRTAGRVPARGARRGAGAGQAGTRREERADRHRGK